MPGIKIRERDLSQLAKLYMIVAKLISLIGLDYNNISLVIAIIFYVLLHVIGGYWPIPMIINVGFGIQESLEGFKYRILTV